MYMYKAICYIYNCITRSIKTYKGNSFNNSYINDVGENKASLK